MKAISTAAVLLSGVVALSAQNTTKPSAYSGVSQPPPDSSIAADVSTPAAKTNAAKPIVAAEASAPPPVAARPADASADYGIVAGASAPSVAHPAADDPDADIVTFVPSHPGELPEGTTIHLTLNQDLSTEDTRPGTDFSGRVTKDVAFSGKVLIPQGSEIVGRVTRVSEGHRFGSPATIRLRPDVVVLPDGSRYVLHAIVIDSNGKSRIDDEGALIPRSHLKKNAIEAGVGAGGGAAVGAAFGGPPGALVGTFVGAGVMTTHILVQHPATVNVPKDTELTLSLTSPMTVTPTQLN